MKTATDIRVALAACAMLVLQAVDRPLYEPGQVVDLPSPFAFAVFHEEG